MTTLRRELASFIEKNLLGEDRGTKIDDATQLIERGLLDSMGLMQVVAFLEERTGVRVPDEEVGPENFDTIVAIEQMVDRLQSRRSGA